MRPGISPRRPALRLALLLGAALLAVFPLPARAQELLSTFASPAAAQGGYFGEAVAGVPDVDGDGKGDLLVGAPREASGGLVGAGRAYLYSGATRALLLGFASPHPQASGQFGTAVAGVPDVNGDGRGDLLVGARWEDGGASAAGRAYVFSGAGGDLLFELASPHPGWVGQFGVAVAGVPDVDGDSLGDFLVGASLEDFDGGLVHAGRAYVFSGADGTLLRELASPHAAAAGFFGTAVAGVPDANGDGRGDVLIGADNERTDSTATGRAYLFSGADGAVLGELASANPQPEGGFGYAVAGVPDADGDSLGDLLVGAPRESAGASLRAGRAYLFSGATGALLREVLAPAPNAYDQFGGSVVGTDDGDGDGRGDLLVGTGRVYFGGALRASRFSGATGAFLYDYLSLRDGSHGGFGTAVAGIPDVDGDDLGDVLVGAYGELVEPNRRAAGRAHLFGSAPPVPPALAIDLAPSDPPIVIGPRGGRFRCTVTVTNTSTEVQTFEMWSEGTMPDGSTTSPVFGPVTSTLDPGGTLTRTISQVVPRIAPPGLYTYTMHVGTFPALIIASDAFQVAKQPSAPRAGAREAMGGEEEGWAAYTEDGRPIARGDVWPADASGGPSRAGAPGRPSDYALHAARPNPFAARTTLGYDLPQSTHVRLVVYDVLGREVAVLVDGEVEAGRHEAAFDASGLPSGAYLVRLEAGGHVQTRPLTRVR